MWPLWVIITLSWSEFLLSFNPFRILEMTKIYARNAPLKVTKVLVTFLEKDITFQQHTDDIFKTRTKNSNELRLNLKSHQKNSNLRPVSQFMGSPMRVLHAQNTFPVRLQINIFACFSPRINKSYQNECAAGEFFHKNGIIYIKLMDLMFDTVYISHQ